MTTLHLSDPRDTLKAVRETLLVAQARMSESSQYISAEHVDRLSRILEDIEDENAPDAAEFAAMQREAIVPCGNATEGLPISECQKREEGCVCFPAVKTEPDESTVPVEGFDELAVLINQAAAECERIYKQRTAGDYTWTGLLGTFWRATEALRKQQRDAFLARTSRADSALKPQREDDELGTTDDDLPGMWSRSDFEGGDPDTRGYAQRARDAAAEGDYTKADAYLAKVQTPAITVRDHVRATAEHLGLDPDKAEAQWQDRLRANAEPTLWVAVCPACWNLQAPDDPLRGSVSVPDARRQVAAGVAEVHRGVDHQTFVWTERRLREYNRDQPQAPQRFVHPRPSGE